MLGILLAAGTLGIEDEANAESLYCKRVAEGAWPAYRPEVRCD